MRYMFRIVPVYLILMFSVIFPVVVSGYGKYDDEKIKREVDSVFAGLSLRDKVAQLFVVDFVSTNSARMKALQNKLVKEDKIGGLITMNDKMLPALQRLNELNRLAKIPLLVSIDGEWGASMRYKEIPSFPRQMQLGALSSDSLIYKMGYAIGEECRRLNIHVNYAPDVDVNNNPDNPVINSRSFGENKEKVARFGSAYMRGMRDAGVAGSAKHFPGHGDTDVDSHKGLPNLSFSEERLDTLELYPFRHLIDEGVDMVMVGHLEVPALDDSGRPASISRPIITDFLRNKMGYDGIVCTDALNMNGVARSSGLEKKNIPLEAYKAGADILLMAEDVENAITAIETAVKKGELSEAELDIKVKKMLSLKARLGLFDKEYSPYLNLYNIEKKVVSRENISLINQLSKNTITVLKNTGDVLPLKDIRGKKIAYLGYRGEKFGKEFAQTLMRYTRVDTLILRSPVTLKQLEQAKNRLSGYDLIITGFNNTDFRPQKNFGIDSMQMNFITAWAGEQPMVAVYFGSPYAFNRIPGYGNFQAVVLGYTNTLENNFSAAQVVFGGVPALGVLPVSTAGLKEGEGVILPRQIRPGYDRFREPDGRNPFYKYPGIGTEKYHMQQGVICGDRKDAGVPVLLNESSALFTVLPLMADLVEQGKVKPTGFLGDILKFPVKKHENILVSDLLSQRSGLPAVGEGFVFTKESVLNLNINRQVLPEYSNANLFYLYKIIELFDTDVKEKMLRNADALFKALEMNHTSLKSGFRVETTREDLARFFFMLFNGGQYAGKQVISPAAAHFMENLLPYYSSNSNGLKIIQDQATGTVKFSL